MAYINMIILVVACALVGVACLAVLATLLLPDGWRPRRTKRDS
ncbi:hypothetical protein ACTQ49_11585 [Luteococcus sp. Sow4_B9]